MFKYYDLQALSIQGIRLVENKKVLLNTQVIINTWKTNDQYHPSLASMKLNVLFPFISVSITDDMFLLMDLLTVMKQYGRFKRSQRVDYSYLINERATFLSSTNQRIYIIFENRYLPHHISMHF